MLKMQIDKIDFKTQKKCGVFVTAYYCSNCGIRVSENSAKCFDCGHLFNTKRIVQEGEIVC